jgi:TolB-like protein
MGGLFQELRRRHVVRTTLAYAAVVFAVLQLGEIILPAFSADADALIRLLTVGAVLLFPVVVMMAWVYEITPMGIRSMVEVDAEAGFTTPSHGLGHRLAFLGVTVAAVGLAAAWWWGGGDRIPEGLNFRGASVFQGAATTDASGPIGSLAVLPLEDLSGEEGQEFFVAGMHEALVAELSQLESLRVISRTSVVQYSPTGRSVPQIGQDLAVDAVVEGSVFRAEGRVRITVQLIHAPSDTHLWSESYERELSDIITLQREVAEAITQAIAQRLREREGEAGEPPPERLAGAEPGQPTRGQDTPANIATGVAAVPAGEGATDDAASRRSPADPVPLEVQEAAMRGRVALLDGEDGGVERAVVYFREALDGDSSFAPALMGLAGAYLTEGLDGSQPDLMRLDSALAAAEKAVALAPTSPEALELLGATREAVEAVQGSAHQIDVSMPATPMGRFVQEGLAEFEIRIESADDRHRARAFARLLASGRTQDARVLGERLLEDGTDDLMVWEGMEHLLRSESDAQAIVDLRRQRRDVLGEEPGASVRALVRALESQGAAGYWNWKRQEQEARLAAGVPVFRTILATACAALGDRSAALAALEQAAETHDPLLMTVRQDPVWDPFRGDEDFQTAVRKPRPDVR